jgi:hypothetical protein
MVAAAASNAGNLSATPSILNSRGHRIEFTHCGTRIPVLSDVVALCPKRRRTAAEEHVGTFTRTGASHTAALAQMLPGLLDEVKTLDLY